MDNQSNLNLIELMRKTWTAYKTNATHSNLGQNNMVAYMGRNMGSVLLFIAELEAKIDEWQASIDAHPRAWKLMLKSKPFIVVAEDEPYYIKVYGMIRKNEKAEGRWSEEDENYYQVALKSSGNSGELEDAK